jgi:hypothetical protein
MSENSHRLRPTAVVSSSGASSRPEHAVEAMARRTLSAAAIAGASLAGVITVAIGSGAVAALLVPGPGRAFGMVLAVAGVVALVGGVLGGLLPQRLISGARGRRPRAHGGSAAACRVRPRRPVKRPVAAPPAAPPVARTSADPTTVAACRTEMPGNWWTSTIRTVRYNATATVTPKSAMTR